MNTNQNVEVKEIIFFCGGKSGGKDGGKDGGSDGSEGGGKPSAILTPDLSGVPTYLF